LKNKLFYIFIFLFSLNFIHSEPLKLIGNFIMLSVSIEDGRFLLYQRTTKDEKWTPLIFEDFPSTTYFKFFDKNSKSINFGEGGNKNYSEAKITDNTIVYFWQNEVVNIKLIYKLVPSKEKSSADTLIIDLSILNLTEKETEIGYVFCIDTYLGEKSKKHFILPGNILVNTEREITKYAIPSIIQSYDEKIKLGLNIFFNKENQILPDRIFFANWKKVLDTIGNYKVEEGKDFDLKPYSINDSALFLDYKGNQIAPKIELKNRFMLSLTSNIELVTEVSTTTTIDMTTTTTTIDNKSSQTSNTELVNLSLSDLLKLLDKINKKLQNDEKLTDEDIKLSDQILEEIKKRRGKK